jgi:ubiquinone biosynthesis protein
MSSAAIVAYTVTVNLKVILRVLRLQWLLLRHGLSQVFRSRSVSGPLRVRLLLEDAGGTFLKFGQVLSLQPDIVPRAYCDVLFDLLDRVPSFSYQDVEKTFIEDLGRRPTEIFDTFDPQPVASASIGQVHIASLDNRKVAVKVRRPTVERDFETDLTLMRTISAAIRAFRLHRLDWLAMAMDEFAEWTREELDYRHEARHMEALGYNSRDSEIEVVPRLYRELTTRRILVAELLEGITVLDYIRSFETGRSHVEKRLRESGFDPEEFARNIIRNFVRDAFTDGLFHADLHPANLIILPNSAVGYVDFGITGSLSRFARRNMVALTLSLTRANADDMMVHFVNLSPIDENSDIPAFRRGLDEALDRWYERDRDTPVMLQNYTRVMLDMLRLSRETGVWPTPDVIRYIRSVITADGLVTRFAPRLDVAGFLRSVCEDTLERELWRELFTVEQLAHATARGARFASALPATILTLMRRNSIPSSERAAGDEEPGTPERRTSRLLPLGAVALVTALVTVLPGVESEFGWNLFTASLATVAAAATMGLASIGSRI